MMVTKPSEYSTKYLYISILSIFYNSICKRKRYNLTKIASYAHNNNNNLSRRYIREQML